jgi:hypothetical protein
VTAPQVIWLTKTAEDELALFFVEQACSLFDETEIGSERLDFVRAQRAGNQRHRRLWSRMISPAPFLEPAVCTENLSSGVVVVKSAKDGV